MRFNNYCAHGVIFRRRLWFLKILIKTFFFNKKFELTDIPSTWVYLLPEMVDGIKGEG